MIPHIPDHAPFSAAQRSWLNGFFAGLFSVQDVTSGVLAGASARGTPAHSAAALPSEAAPAGPVTILFGSQTGTAEGLARKAARRLAAAGFAPEVHALNDVMPSDLASTERLLVITSTHGEGEMPDNAEIFWEDLAADDAPSLDATAFSVLALGDSSYLDFCQAGKDIDARLEALGARRFHERVDCDVDVDEPFEAWVSGVIEALPMSARLARAA